VVVPGAIRLLGVYQSVLVAVSKNPFSLNDEDTNSPAALN